VLHTFLKYKRTRLFHTPLYFLAHVIFLSTQKKSRIKKTQTTELMKPLQFLLKKKQAELTPSSLIAGNLILINQKFLPFFNKSPLETLFLMFSPFTLKYLNLTNTVKSSVETLYNLIAKFYFYSLHKTNLLPANIFEYNIKKKIVKVFNFKKFTLLTTP